MTDAPQRPLLGVALVTVSVFFFALGDVLTKDLAERFPAPIIIAMRYLVSLALLMGLVWPRIGARLWQTQRPRLVILRGAVLSLSSLMMVLALKRMPVGETVSIMYLSPFAVMALAAWIYSERPRALGWALAVCGFAGVLLIVRPGSGLDPLGVLFATVNACLATVFHLMTRGLSRSESAISLLFYVSAVGSAVYGAAALPFVTSVAPSLIDLGQMAAVGGLMTTGHFLFSLAYREAPASLVAPANYLHLVCATLLGWVAFGHIPQGWTIAGMALIFGSGVGLAFLAHLDKPVTLQRTPVA